MKFIKNFIFDYIHKKPSISTAYRFKNISEELSQLDFFGSFLRLDSYSKENMVLREVFYDLCKDVNKNNKKLILNIYSDGGDTSCLSSFLSVIMNYKEFESRIYGKACSCAALLAFHADKVYFTRNSKILFHCFRSKSDGYLKAKELSEIAHSLDTELKRYLEQIIAKRSNLFSQRQLEQIKSGEDVIMDELSLLSNKNIFLI